MRPGSIPGLILGTILIGLSVYLFVSPPDADFFKEDDSMRYLLAVTAAILGLYRIYSAILRLRSGK